MSTQVLQARRALRAHGALHDAPHPDAVQTRRALQARCLHRSALHDALQSLEQCSAAARHHATRLSSACELFWAFTECTDARSANATT